MMAVVQPVNAGTTGVIDPVVVVVGNSSGPVSNSANESTTDPDSEFPTALQRNSDAHDTDDRVSPTVPRLGLETTDQTKPSQESTDVRTTDSPS